MRADLDAFLGHEEGAVQEREIADRAGGVDAERNGAAGIKRNMIADHHGARLAALEVPENLRAFAVKAGAEMDVRRNRLLPPIAFDAPVGS